MRTSLTRPATEEILPISKRKEIELQRQMVRDLLEKYPNDTQRQLAEWPHSKSCSTSAGGRWRASVGQPDRVKSPALPSVFGRLRPCAGPWGRSSPPSFQFSRFPQTIRGPPHEDYVIEVKISEIKIGDRFRKEMGDSKDSPSPSRKSSAPADWHYARPRTRFRRAKIKGLPGCPWARHDPGSHRPREVGAARPNRRKHDAKGLHPQSSLSPSSMHSVASSMAATAVRSSSQMRC